MDHPDHLIIAQRAHRTSDGVVTKQSRPMVVGNCHANGVCHRDLKPENLLLDEQGVLKISDFGLSARQQPSEAEEKKGGGGEGGGGAEMTPLHLLHTTCGTPNYVAPEVLMDQGYDGKAADVWSAGVILYVLLAGYLPFDEVSMVDLFRKIVKVEFTYPPHFSEEAIDLLNRILTPKVEQRATMQEIQRHPWMRREMTGEAMEVEGPLPPVAGTGEVVPVVDSLSSRPSPQTSPRLSSVDGLSSTSPLHPTAALAALDGALSLPAGTRVETSPSSHPLDAPDSVHSTPLSLSLSIGGPAPSASTFADPHAFHRTDSKLLLTMDEDEEEEEVAQRRALADPTVISYGPRKMNAFDLINMVGGAAMNRMFIRGLGGKSRQVKTTQFTSTASCELLLQRLQRVLSDMEGVECQVHGKYAQVRAVKEGDRGQVAMCCQVYEMTDSLHLVECRKIKGDLFFYNDLYREVKRRMEGMDSPSSSTLSRTPALLHPRREAKEEVEDEETVIKAGSSTLTLSRPGSGEAGTGGGGAVAIHSSGSGSAFRGKLSILITPSTPVKERGEGDEKGGRAVEGERRVKTSSGC